jgi:hypothetical protein
MEFSLHWLGAQRGGDCASDYHMNLMAWSISDPGYALAIVLSLVGLVANERECDEIADSVALGPVEWIVSNAPEWFDPILKDALVNNRDFEVMTRHGLNSDSAMGRRLRTLWGT